jgi:hypothetical protein
MIASAIAGGLLGTVVLTTIVRAASEMNLTRMDLTLILGTMVTIDRRRARAYGYAMHFGIGLVFALLYVAVFVAIHRTSWWLGALFGALHAVFLGVVVINVLLPLLHPLMGAPETSASEHALIEPPGFLMLNYGRSTFVITLLAHMAFGAVVGWAVRL